MNAHLPSPRKAADQPAPAASPKSPCVDICRMDAARRLCTGCLRTLDEIGGWSGFSDDEKRAVLAAVAARRTKGE
ncbi:DUF1289 domain-containing protein [Rhodocyclus tenuis]|uniref:DUF1289 domain-containing protein n=2 Tax=Rhodocyclus TaxID=1064 RepID=A0A6L5JX00_RHOTE|nr:DUF1289 domain-containing protein [Rhodocyclus gracilis]MRD72085.1 DUF1289 domain-containing protein [Rhodocyclus gracilis]NJA89189.1 DUF1289 domain-containing protein [Rhodocyclus gracilis]